MLKFHFYEKTIYTYTVKSLYWRHVYCAVIDRVKSSVQKEIAAVDGRTAYVVSLRYPRIEVSLHRHTVSIEHNSETIILYTHS